jgi:hypothetical protein
MHEPDYAPLSRPLWRHLTAQYVRVRLTSSWYDEEAIARIIAALGARRGELYRRFEATRAAVTATLEPFVRIGHLTAATLLRMVEQERQRRFNRSILTAWRQGNLIRPAGDAARGVDPAAAAAILIVGALTPDLERGWLPPRIDPDEPWWWCWEQGGPDRAPVPCPVPVPPNADPLALRWTPWLGAAWSAPWQRMGVVAVAMPEDCDPAELARHWGVPRDGTVADQWREIARLHLGRDGAVRGCRGGTEGAGTAGNEVPPSLQEDTTEEI